MVGSFACSQKPLFDNTLKWFLAKINKQKNVAKTTFCQLQLQIQRKWNRLTSWTCRLSFEYKLRSELQGKLVLNDKSCRNMIYFPDGRCSSNQIAKVGFILTSEMANRSNGRLWTTKWHIWFSHVLAINSSTRHLICGWTACVLRWYNKNVFTLERGVGKKMSFIIFGVSSVKLCLL